MENINIIFKRIYNAYRKIKHPIIDLMLIGLIIMIIYWIQDFKNNAIIIGQFEHAQDITRGIHVYFRGHKIGKVVKIMPGKDFKNVLIYFKIKTEYLKLPKNVIAKTTLSKDKRTFYIKIEYPEKSSLKNLKRGSVIIGKTPVNLQDFLEKQIQSGMLDSITDDVSGTMENLNKTSEKINKAMNIVISILDENKPYISQTINNTQKSSENLVELTENINSILCDKKIKSDIKAMFNNSAGFTNKINTEDVSESLLNIKQSTRNIKNATKNIDCATRKLNITMEKTNSTLSATENVMKNVSLFTENSSKVLSKRFLFLRLFFGKPGKEFENNSIRQKNK